MSFTLPGTVITVPTAPWIGEKDPPDSSDFDKGSFNPITGTINDDINDGHFKDIVTDPVSGEQQFIDHDKDLDEIISNTVDSYSESSKDRNANDSYLTLYKQTGESGYLEKYLDNIIARENTQSARDYEKMMSDTAVSRMMQDIKSAGYNPWLALQSSVSQASSGNGVAAGSSGINNASLSNSAKNNMTSNIFGLVGDVLRAVVMLGLLYFRK